MSYPAPPPDRPTSVEPADSIRSEAVARSISVMPELLQRAPRWATSEEARRACREAAADVAEGGWRVLRSIRPPTRQVLLDFFTQQVVVNVVGWISGLATAHVVTQLFEVKGFRNLWGLAASGRRALVTPDDYRLIMTLTGFTVGLLMMLVVRHLLMRWISETRALRAERRGCLTYGPEGGRRPTATEFDAHDVDHDS